MKILHFSRILIMLIFFTGVQFISADTMAPNTTPVQSPEISPNVTPVVISTPSGIALNVSANVTVSPSGNTTQSPNTQMPAPGVSANTTSVISDNPVSDSITPTDQQFLFLMNQYWIPDLYEIKGRIDGSLGYYSEFPELLNMSEQYASNRLNKNINETMSYNLSAPVSKIRTDYQTCAREGITVIDRIQKMNQSSPKFIDNATTQSASLSLYGSWMEYQTMKAYNLPNMTYPDMAKVPSDQFKSVMSSITT